MSYEDGIAALRLEMPNRVPRTELSLEMHWELIRAVTGINAGEQSSPEDRQRAAKAIYQAWNYDFLWNAAIFSPDLGAYRTFMGHAVYADQGADFTPVGKTAFDDPDQVLAFDPMEAIGRKDHRELVARFEKHYADSVSFLPTAVNMTGTYITLMSGFIDLFGWDLLLTAAGVDPVGFGELANRYAKWMQQYFDAIADSNVPVVMVHDDIVWTAGAFMKPDWYRKYIFPNFKRYFDPVLQAGKILCFTSDGNYTEFIDDIVALGPRCFVMEPCTDMAYFAGKYGKTHAFIGNADTRILLKNDRRAIRAEVERCMAIGKHCPGFFMNIGNHIPPNTPVEAAIYYNQVYEELSKR